MITAWIDPQAIQTSVLFRGKPIDFWLRQIYDQFTFVGQINFLPQCQHLIVFNPEKFLKIKHQEIEQFTRWLLNQPESFEEIISLPDCPFLILPNKILPQIKDFSLSSLTSMPYVTLPWNEKVLDIYYDPLEIDQCIIDFQIFHYQKEKVIIEDFNQFFIEGLIPIGQNSLIGSGVVIKGNSIIGENVTLFPNVYIENSKINNKCIILPGSVIRDSVIEEFCQIGPFTHLRNGATVKRNAKMGNFVEMKKSVLGEGSKAMHLTYIGDAHVGKNVNIGAGTITCNYDGKQKNQTMIEDNVFVGSGTELIAPIVIHKNSFIGAGSTINQDVPENALAIARTKQRNILNFSKRKEKKRK